MKLENLIPQDTKALLFDCDGTLADTMPAHTVAWKQTLNQWGLDVSESVLNSYAGIPTIEIVRSISKRFNHPLDAQQVSIERDTRAESLLSDVKPIKPVVDILLEHLDSHLMAVISGGARQHVEKSLRQIGLIDHFQEILTADDPYPPKPNPDLFLEAARRLKVEPNKCVVFEDGESGLIAARSAGMLSIDVRKFTQYPTR